MSDPVTLNVAAKAVTCPRCKARPGHRCTSTGGGNFAYVPVHAVRRRRVEAWTNERAQSAAGLVRQLERLPWSGWPITAVDALAAFEAAAEPVEAKPAGTSTPKGARLSEAQAERIEWAAQAGGRYTVSTAHFHGDAADRQSVQALEGKGILAEVGRTSDGYDRVLELTEFGWQVYRQHRLIIRRDLPGQTREGRAP